MAVFPTTIPTSDSLDQLLRYISEFDSAGLIDEFLRYYPQHELGVQMCRLVLEKISGSGCNNRSGGLIDVNSSVSPAPVPLSNISSIRYYVNLLSNFLEEVCPNRVDPNLISSEDACLAALQQTIMECLKNVRQRRLMNGTQQQMQNGMHQGGISPSFPPTSSFPVQSGIPQQSQMHAPSIQQCPQLNGFYQQERFPQAHNQMVTSGCNGIPQQRVPPQQSSRDLQQQNKAPQPSPLLSCSQPCNYQQPNVSPTATMHISPTVTDSSVLMSRALEEQLSAIPEPPPCKRKEVDSSSQMLPCNTVIDRSNVAHPCCTNRPSALASKQHVKFEEQIVPCQTKNVMSSIKVSPSSKVECNLGSCIKEDQTKPAISLPSTIEAPNLMDLPFSLGEIFSTSGPTTLTFRGQINAVDGSGDNTIGKMTLSSLLSQLAPMLLRPYSTVNGQPVFSGSLGGSAAGHTRTFDSNKLKAWVMDVVEKSSSGNQCEKSQGESEEHILKYLMELVSSWRSLYSR